MELLTADIPDGIFCCPSFPPICPSILFFVYIKTYSKYDNNNEINTLEISSICIPTNPIIAWFETPPFIMILIVLQMNEII